MTKLMPQYSGETLEIFAAAESAMARIPPAFPLAATVAVNPFLGQASESRVAAAARLGRVGGIKTTGDRAEVARMIVDGRIDEEDLKVAAAEAGISPTALREAANQPAPDVAPLCTVADLAQKESGQDWPGLVAERIGLWAAGHFDEGQALWPAPKLPVFRSWRSFATRDLSPGIAGIAGFNDLAARLPDDPKAAFVTVCGTLGLTPDAATLYLHRLLVSLGGWSQFVRSRVWLAERDGGSDDTLFGLLVARAAWDAALLKHYEDSIAPKWAETLRGWSQPLVPTDDQKIDAALQEAADRSAERRLRAQVEAPLEARPKAEGPAIQAAFCIDVRSEILRRALETADDGVETIGFAGFFGLAAAHRAAASDTVEARAPVLLQPAVESAAGSAPSEDFAARVQRRTFRAWGRFKLATVSSFAFVEAAGPLYAVKLVKDAVLGPKNAPPEAPPRLDLPLETRTGAAAQILRAMSLTEGFARLVLIAGHGSTVTNAPHGSALQCGACGGHAGDVNARLLASLLNDPEVRETLAAGEGIEIPAETLFVAGLHDTVSDRVDLFADHEETGHREDLDRLKAALSSAAALARAERALTLPRAADAESLPARGADWSELRPEWGLAGCSAFIAAPRHRTAGRDLGGRAFLHSYDWRADDGFSTLELILTAPVVVASWISLQYFGSSVAPDAFGAGNKLLHNVTGGIGVVEGNGGLLRAGLPWQSVHDGDALRHEPLRLSVVVEAPTEAISAILDKHQGVRDLFDNGWLSLHAIDADGRVSRRYDAGRWTEIAGKEALAA